MNAVLSSESAHELRFRSLFNPGRGLAFPCDAAGHVDIDALRPIARQNYFYAQTVVGCEFATPIVVDLSTAH